jgi:polyphosphate kinase
MNRNMLRRIELAWPVIDPALRQRVIDECLVPYLLDGRDAWVMDGQGRYQSVAGRSPENPHGAQQALMQLHRPVPGGPTAVPVRRRKKRRP